VLLSTSNYSDSGQKNPSVTLQAWKAEKQGDEERTKLSWKIYRICHIIAAIWFLVVAVIYVVLLRA
jgi:hypothetical protein